MLDLIDQIIMALILLMIAGAVVAIETPHMLHSVISIGAVGFLLSIVFLFLSAPDLAITQIAVEVVTLVLLLRAVGPADQQTDVAKAISLSRVIAVCVVILLLIVAGWMVGDFPRFGDTVMDRLVEVPSQTYLRDGLAQTGAANMVTAILLDYRAYDTLGEATVLFCAVIGALVVMHRYTGDGSDTQRREVRNPEEES